MRKTILICSLALALSANFAAAQPAQPTAGASVIQARMPAAVELVSIMRLPDFMRGTLPLIWQQLVSPLISRDDPRVKEAVDSLAPMLTSEMEGELPRFAQALAGIYAAQFTEDELRALATFMRSPVGQSYLGKQTQIAQASLAVGQQFGQALATRLQARIEEELKRKLGR